MIDTIDVVLRHQFVTERIKRGRERAVAALMALIATLVRSHFSKVRVDTFADMTRAQFMAFVTLLRAALAEELTAYQSEAFEWYKTYASKDADLATIIYAFVTGQSIDKAADGATGTLHGPQAVTDNDRLWSKIAAAIIPALGEPLWQSFTTVSAYSINMLIRRVALAQPNAETPAQTLEALLGRDDLRNLDGTINTVNRAVSAVERTAVQHTAMNAQGATQSVVFERYQWVSVLDSKTTTICRERNGRTYVWGQGPLPPAHPNCRSSIVGYNLHPGQVPPTVDEWLGSQPTAIREYLESTEPLGLAALPKEAARYITGQI